MLTILSLPEVIYQTVQFIDLQIIDLSLKFNYLYIPTSVR